MKHLNVNYTHELQDIGRERLFDPSRSRYQFALNLLPNSSNMANLIDIGGGAGEFTELARKKGYQTLLVDGNPTNVQRELARGFKATCCDLTYGLQNISNEKFDVAVSLEVIEHIISAEELLLEMFRVIKPGGVLILSTPNFGYIRDRIHYINGKDLYCEGYHYRFYTKSKLLKMLHQAGFVLDKTNSIGSALGINFVLRLLTLGKLRIRHFRSPKQIESWHCSTFVWKLKRNLI